MRSGDPQVFNNQADSPLGGRSVLDSVTSTASSPQSSLCVVASEPLSNSGPCLLEKGVVQMVLPVPPSGLFLHILWLQMPQS